MEKITYIDRVFIDRFRVIDTLKSFTAFNHFSPENTDLIYFKIDRFNYKTIDKNMIKSIEKI